MSVIDSKVQHEPLPEGSFDPTYPNPLPPERPTMLEAEIKAIIIGKPGDTIEHAARRILKIPRIARALKLLDDVDSGAVDLITYGSKQESSDAR